MSGLEAGTRLGSFEIVGPLGAGGMGEVYRARDLELDRQVALKVLPAELADDPHGLDRMRREAKALASLNHAHVATVHGLHEDGGRRFIVMELVEGPTLADRLAAGPLELHEALRVASQLTEALEAAHAAQIVHRDLKPANVKISPSGGVKVLDFGLAKPLRAEDPDSDPELPTATVEPTRAGALLGTAPYMSPEQARGEEVDERTDVWAFGCLVYEMLTGEPAFLRPTGSETLAAVLRDGVDLDRLPAATPDAVVRLLRRSLRKDPERRLRHIGDARLELEEALEATGVARTPHAPARERRGTESAQERPVSLEEGSGVATAPPEPGSGRRARLVAVAALVGALVIVALAVWSLGGAGRPEITDRSIAVLPFESLGTEETSSFTDGIHGDMLTRLSEVSGLEVTSRTSVMRFRQPDRPLPEIARELGVTWVLLGEVQEVGDQVQVQARLVNAAQDRQVWAESYRRRLTAENVFAIQADLTRRIAERLQARLTPEERRAVERSPTDDLEAYRLYARGRTLVDQRTEGPLRQAVGVFQQAIAIDPVFAPAWAGLADALVLLEWYGHEPPADAPEPRAALDRALALGPEMAEVHTSFGIFHSMREEGPEALRALQTAIELRPSYAEAHVWLGWMYLPLGRPEAGRESAARSVELDPLSPVTHVYLAETHLANGDATSALREVQRARELQPDYGVAHWMEGLVLYHLGRLEEAEASVRAALPLVPPDGYPSHAEIRSLEAVIDVARGDQERARGLLATFDFSNAPFSAGLVHAALGEADAAFEAFARIEEWRSFTVEQFRFFYADVLGPLRDDPRYAELLAEVDRAWGVER